MATLLALAGPAAADPPQPTDYRSVIDAVEPATDALDVEVVGGDSFLQVTVEPDHEVVVEGYQGEPYLRFRADGTVERNRRSPATYANEDRQGDVELPADADPEADPDWEEVASGGRYAWHDHRIHWMNPGRPDGEPGDVIQGWTVVLTVDGEPTAIEGRLLWVEPANPWPWVVLAAVVLAGLAVVGRLRSGWARTLAAGATVLAAAVALVVGVGQYADAPAQGAASPLLVAVPAVALVVGLAGLAGILRGRGRAGRAGIPWGPVATLAGVAAVLGWAALRLEVLWKPVLPTTLPANLDRAGTALALALAAGAAALVVASGGLVLGRPPRLRPTADAPGSTARAAPGAKDAEGDGGEPAGDPDEADEPAGDTVDADGERA
ncbi:MAG TPA: hypothetical protein VIL48_01735 [Acidimicrobiales bacterium]